MTAAVEQHAAPTPTPRDAATKRSVSPKRLVPPKPLASPPNPKSPPTLRVNEIFLSIQGESTHAGLPCTFVRLTGCHLRCHYCDTAYAFHEGDRITLDDIIARVKGFYLPKEPPRLVSPAPQSPTRLVEITGGEPLLQPNVHPLMTRLCDLGFTVLIETSGACDIGTCDPRVHRIMDLKTPGSGESHRNHWPNIEELNERDEVKFVLTSRGDYEWARAVIEKHSLAARVAAVLMSAVQETPAGADVAGVPPGRGLPLRDLAHWILDDHLPVRLQTQLHKLIWDPAARGV